MNCEKCQKSGARYYVNFTDCTLSQFDPEIWTLCTTCAEGTMYARLHTYESFLRDSLKNQELRQINSRWPDQESALTTLIRGLLSEVKDLIEEERKETN